MMGYEGGDLLLTGAAWPMVGSLRKPVCAGCGWRPAAPVSDESAFEVAYLVTAGLRGTQKCAIQIDGLTFLSLQVQLIVWKDSSPK